MAGDSTGRVTITLGRTGQVVKRAAAVLDVEYGDHSMQAAGSKRSVRDRLGANFDNKRQRGESYLTRLNSNGVEDARIGKDDLRLKLMQKNASRRAANNYEQNTMDLRGKLSRTVPPPSRTVQPPGPSLGTVDTRQRLPGPKDPSILSRIPSTRSVNDSQLMDSSRNSYSPWTLDHIRSRSPDRIIGSSRALSPTRHIEDVQRRPLSRTFDDARAIPYVNKDVFDAQRPVSGSTAFMAKPVLPSVSSKPAAPVLGHLPPPSGILQKSSYVGEEQTIEGLLHSLGLGKYAILFKAEEVDMTALKQMGEGDLKELGIPMGPRKKILLALLPRTKRQP